MNFYHFISFVVVINLTPARLAEELVRGVGMGQERFLAHLASANIG